MFKRSTGLALLIALALAAPAHADTTLGMNVGGVFYGAFDGWRWERHFAAIEQDGIRVVRSDSYWQDAEPQPPVAGAHAYSWTIADLHMLTLERHDLRWQPVIGYSAEWASSHPAHVQHAPPTDPADYAAYAAAFAARYGRGGAFWAAHPALTPLPVTTYEIWNEPNFSLFWQPHPDAAAYADLYIRARTAIKAVDPDARVIVGGLYPDDADAFLSAMYAARPELHGAVDGAGLHPYWTFPDGVYARVRSMRATLESLGEGGVPIDVTEIGWQTSGAGSALVVPEDVRAANLEAVTDTLARSDCNVASVIPYTWTTAEADPANPEHWYGIVHDDAAMTPSRAAYARVVARMASDPPATPTYLCHPAPPPPPPDTDGDGSADPSDPDDDADGVPDATDPFPLDRTESRDGDGDGIGDTADPDDDGDGVADVVDLFPLDRAESRDADRDGRGDNGDPDDDNDGLTDVAERAGHTSPLDVDSDDDGLADGAERRTSPRDRDSDNDHVPDGVELGVAKPLPAPAPGVAGTDRARFVKDRDPRTRTDPMKHDSDRDGLSDGREDRNGNGRRDSRETDPRKRDTDGDGVNDRRDGRPLDRRRH